MDRTTSSLSRIQLGEAKRRYEAHFVNKLTDCDAENNETDTWLTFARDCGYLNPEEYRNLVDGNRVIGAMLGSMISDPRRLSPAPLFSKPPVPLRHQA